MNALCQLTLNFLQKQYVKFIITGSVNTLFGYSIFSLLIFLNLHYALASFLATCLGVLFNMQTFSKFVFSQHQNNTIRFIFVYLTTYLLNILIIKSGTSFLHNLYLLGFIATIICAFVSYYLNKNYVFKSVAKVA